MRSLSIPITLLQLNYSLIFRHNCTVLYTQGQGLLCSSPQKLLPHEINKGTKQRQCLCLTFITSWPEPNARWEELSNTYLIGSAYQSLDLISVCWVMCGRYQLTLAAPDVAAMHPNAVWRTGHAVRHAPRNQVRPTTSAPVLVRPTSAKASGPPSSTVDIVLMKVCSSHIYLSYCQRKL